MSPNKDPGMHPGLERAYRRLLRAYPPSVRATRGEEILATLAETTPPGRRLPPAREAAALVVGGLRARARLAVAQGPARIWADGLQLAVLLLGLLNLTFLAGAGGIYPLWSALFAGATIATLRGYPRLAFGLLALTTWGAGGPDLLPVPLLAHFDWAPYLGVSTEFIALAVALVALAVLAVTPLRAQVKRRSLWWVPVGAALWILDTMSMAPQLAVIAAALVFALVAFDPRPAIAAITMSAVISAQLLSWAGPADPVVTAYWLTVLGSVPLVLWAAVRATRRQRLEL